MDTSLYNNTLRLIAASNPIDLFINACCITHSLERLLSPVWLPQKAGLCVVATLVGT
jgi:hypothetical protein